MRKLTIGALVALFAAWGCGPATVRPVSFPDPDVSCPAGRVSWGLEIQDQRVAHQAEAKMTASVKDAIQKSFPGCRWGSADADSGTIAIEVHRFGSHLDAGYWEAAVEWTVTARDAAGHVLTQFEVNEEVTRPNYQGSDNEKESLSEAFGKGVARTAKGLTAMSVSEGPRPPEGTVARVDDPRVDGASERPTALLSTASGASARVVWDHGRLERISQPETSEVS